MIELSDMDRMIVKPGDVLVLRPKEAVSLEQLERMKRHLELVREESGCCIIVIDHGIEVMVAGKDELPCI